MNPPYPRAVHGPKRRKHGQRTLDLPSQLVEELKSEAARLGRPLSSLVQMAWRLSRGLPSDPPPRGPQPWEAIAAELEDRLNYPSKRSSAARAWMRFEAWCVEHQLLPCPARDETLLGYARACLALGMGRKDALRAAAAVAVVHRVRGHKPPRLRPSAPAVVDQLLASVEASAAAK